MAAKTLGESKAGKQYQSMAPSMPEMNPMRQ